MTARGDLGYLLRGRHRKTDGLLQIPVMETAKWMSRQKVDAALTYAIIWLRSERFSNGFALVLP